MNLNYIEVDIEKSNTMQQFSQFYNEILNLSLDENQIETFSQLSDTLAKKKGNFFGKNSYHILLIQNQDSTTVGGIIYDYFFDSNVGLIEYIVTDPKFKKQGIATYAYNTACSLLNIESKKNGFDRINFVCCEVEKINSSKCENHYFWENFGFKKLNFDYIQPSLDEGKEIVRDMDFGIITQTPNIPFEQSFIKKDILKSILHDYAYYTMRINKPEEEPFFIEMCNGLENQEEEIELK